MGGRMTVPTARTDGEGMAPELRIEFEAVSASAGEAREFIRCALEAWDCDDPDEIAVLLTSEVVSNAVRHAATALALDVSLDDDSLLLRIEVRDSDSRLPVLHRPSIDATGGRGILLVDTLARRWGARPEDGGKVVWFELAARRRAQSS